MSDKLLIKVHGIEIDINELEQLSAVLYSVGLEAERSEIYCTTSDLLDEVVNVLKRKKEKEYEQKIYN